MPTLRHLLTLSVLLPFLGLNLPAAQPRALLIGGGTHHDFPRWFNQTDTATLTAAGFEVTYTDNVVDATRLLPTANTVIFSTNQPTFSDPAFRTALATYLNQGHGLVFLHAATWRNMKDWPQFYGQYLGQVAQRHDKYGPVTTTLVAPQHPVVANLPASFTFADELYHLDSTGPGAPCDILATTQPSAITSRAHTAIWTRNHAHARIVGITLGHDGAAHENPAFKTLLTNAARWTVSTPAAPPATTTLNLFPAPAGIPLSRDFTVTINGQPLDLYTATTRYGSNASFANFEFSGEIEVEVHAHHIPPHSASFTILPEHAAPRTSTLANGHIRFRLSQPTTLTFLVVGDYTGHTLQLIAQAPEATPPPRADDPNVIYFAPGLHDIGPATKWEIRPRSGQTIYLAGGAYVRGHIVADEIENLTIRGRGILAQGPAQSRTHGLQISDSKNLKLSGILLTRTRDGWSGSIRRSREIHIDDYHVISPAIWSTDGINFLNCQNVLVENSTFRCGDDNIAIKGFGASGSSRDTTEDPRTGQPNRDILIRNCQFWSDNNTAVVLGQETKASAYENITVRDSDVLFCRDDAPEKAALALVCLHATDYKNILFENIRVGPSGQLLAAFNTESIFQLTGNQSWPGVIDGVTFRNITTTGAGSKTIYLRGWSPTKPLRNLTLENIRIRGQLLAPNSAFIDANPHVENLLVR